MPMSRFLEYSPTKWAGKRWGEDRRRDGRTLLKGSESPFGPGGPGGPATASPLTISAMSFWVTPPSALTKPRASPNSKVRPGAAVIARTRWRRRPQDLQLPHEVNQVGLFLGSELEF